MSDNESDFDYQSKKLALELKENEAKYVSGELSLDQPLQKIEELYESAVKASEKTTANGVLLDSSLMQLTAKIVRQCAKSYKTNTVDFEPMTFSEKLVEDGVVKAVAVSSDAVVEEKVTETCAEIEKIKEDKKEDSEEKVEEKFENEKAYEETYDKVQEKEKETPADYTEAEAGVKRKAEESDAVEVSPKNKIVKDSVETDKPFEETVQIVESNA